MGVRNYKFSISYLTIKIQFSILCILISTITFSQDIQWANKVLGFSSERTDIDQGPQYRAKQILGKPNILPQFFESRCAWSPASADSYGEDWIKVGFEKPQKIKQIAIAENFNPGCIVRIFGYDSTDVEHLLHENKEKPPHVAGRMWNVIIPETAYTVYAIKLVLSPTMVKGYNQIDAIGISASDQPYEAKINLARDIPKELLKENLGINVNSRYGEVAPIITPDGKNLFFTRIKHPDNLGISKKQDIWLATLGAKNEWELARNIDSPVNNIEDNAAATISSDGKTLYILNVYNPDGSLRVGLSQTKKTKNGWAFPQEVKIEKYYSAASKINTNRGTEEVILTEFSISPNKDVLIMALNRKDTYGEKDLYVSFLNEKGEFSQPINMGAEINTSAIESNPFISSDSKSLYFTSFGHPGYGDGDIFISRRLDSTWTHWSEPENLGPIINTPKWDGYFTIPASGDFAYLSSSENSIGGEDIFRIKLFPSIKPDPVAIISGLVINGMDKLPIAADIHVENLKDTLANKVIKTDFDPETGEFKIIVPVGKSYSIKASKKGYLGVSEEIDLTKDKKFREVRKNITLIPIREGQKIVLNNLFFEQSLAEINAISKPELNRIIELMNEYPKMEVLLEGHTDNQGDMMLNVQLSEKRVIAVKEYLVTEGKIAENRISIKAWGPARPIASNATEETRKKNRRVEFTITKL